MHMCPSCPSHPKCATVPQRILQDSVIKLHVHTCVQAVHPIPKCGKCYGAAKDPIGLHKVHTHAHVSKLSVPSQNVLWCLKNPTEFRKVNVYMHVSTYFPKLSIPFQMCYAWCLKISYRIPKGIPNALYFLSFRCHSSHA